MATVRNTIQLQDKFTPVLRSMIKAMNSTTNAMAGMDNISGKAFNQMKRDVQAANNALEDLNRGTNDLQNPIQKTGGKFSGWAMAITGVNAALQITERIVGAISKGIKTVTEAYDKQLTADLQLAVVLGNQSTSFDELERNYELIQAEADRLKLKTSIGNEMYIAGAAEISTYLKDGEAVAKMMDTLGNYAVGMGGTLKISQEQMVNYATQLGKALDGTYDGLTKKGFALTDAQKQVIENGTDMERALVISDVINQSWADLAENMANLPSGQIEKTNTMIGEMYQAIGEKLLPLQAAFAYGLSQIIPTIQNAILTATDFIINNIDKVVMVLSVLAGIALAVGVAMEVAWMIANWPILLIIGAIVLLISILQSAGVTANDVITFISGLFGGLYAFIHNIVADLWNILAVFGEFIMNVFDDPLGSVVRLFAGVFDTILGIIETVAGAIGALLGKDWGAGISGFRDDLNKAVEEKFGTPAIEIARMEKKNTLDTVNAWASAGNELANNLDNVVGSLEHFKAGIDLSKIGFGANGLEIAGGDLDSIGKIKGDVSITDDDLKLLKDIAVAGFTQNYTTMRPEMTVNISDVKETADLNKIMVALEDMVEEAYASTLIGE